ncbi:hypothetical protein [Thaumasiovibrio subtropicus]|uniref:hypothetical protein n=1 Tax=Thaumasiovibrio subtropicus TaxID=1891207 RepID=UPI000B35AD98|nr:hypothetical protein [Thaumasiovibrio subtropicus]
MKKAIVTVTLGLILTACASHEDVRPGADGVHYVSIAASDAKSASREAIKQAQSYCDSHQQGMYVVDEDNFYEGTMTQDQYETHKTIANVASAAGTALWVFGDGKVDDAGGVAAIAGGIYGASLEDPYVTTLSFQCK